MKEFIKKSFKFLLLIIIVCCFFISNKANSKTIDEVKKGAVKGDIDVRGPVILGASAIVMGNIKSKAVQINNGAVIEGMCSQCYADVNPTAFFDDYKKGKNK